ncbi:hypothetical protein BGZ58_009987 [Dissophora ornata]|nr:hypothetical protein BGZ58_009987 [Dissophora ornata]
MPTAIHRSTIFKPRQRVENGGSQVKQLGVHEHSGSQTHMPWVDGRALTCALLAVCFRRDGHESEEAEALEESKAVPIVSEILKYDCMLTAQSLGQAVLAVAYSRPAGSLKRTYEQRLKRQHRQEQGSSSGRPEPVSRASTSSSTGESETSASGVDMGVMDLLMERIGPREWLKLIKYYLQRQEFEDLSVILELCPFKGPQLEIKQKGVENGYRYDSRAGARDVMTQNNYHRQQARELICREAGICGVGSRLGHFNGRSIGQTSYNVSATLHRISRMIFTGSGTVINHSYMLPRGGFRGIGGNTSGQPSSTYNSGGGNDVDSGESYSATEEDSHQSTPTTESGHPFDQPQSSNIPQQQGQWRSQFESNNLKDNGNHYTEEEVVTDDDDDLDLNPDQLDIQDSSLTFGGIGSSTTSNSHPGPGIVGIAIQVQAPEHILKSLLKMGFRFFSICDLSISDTRHPLALQFKQQEKMNRQLIEFCMVPNTDVPLEREYGEGCSRQESKRKTRKTSRRDKMALYDAVDQEYHAQAVERFLYPAANNPARPSASIPALPSQVQGSSGNRSGTTEAQQLSAMTIAETAVSGAASSLAVQEPPTAQVSSTLSPSNRLQFVLPPMHLGESFESIASANTTDITYQSSVSNLQRNPPLSAQLSLSQTQYRSSGLAESIPLPIRKSMTESKRAVKSYMSESSPSVHYGESPTISTHQRMVNATTRRRVREYLSSEYIDLMTVGICLHQACYHQKERLLTVLLEHRLLIAQDALSGAVQVAASVGWRRGLEMLLMEHGDMEAEVDPVVTTTSEQVHHGTSMKWDHASVAPLDPGKPRGASHHSSVSSSGAAWEVFVVNRGLRRHQSDGSRLNRSNSSYTNVSGSSSDNNEDRTGAGIGGGFRRETVRTFEITRRASFDFSYSAPLSTSVVQPHLSSAPILPHMGPLTPTIRSSSLRRRLLPFLPNLSSSNEPSSVRKKQKAKRQPEQSQKQCHDMDGKNQLQQRPHKPVAALLLSTSGLWSQPAVMMQRKNKNAVIALMAATTRNDPDLVHWLVESFADIKIVHLMQALMIACDRGLIRVVQVLVGDTAMVRSSDETENGIRADKNTPRLLFRRWLTFQYKKIVELALLASGVEDTLESSKSDFNQQRFDSFPFVFLMESSPIFRHYYQTLNTLSSCQFVTRKGTNHRISASASPPFQANTGHSMMSMTDNNTSSIPAGSIPLPPSSPLRLHRRSQQLLQVRAQEQPSTPASPCEQPPVQQRLRTRLRTAQETKHEITRIMLEPVLETFGSISFRKALDRMPTDCWWPLDQDVRMMVDQEARKSMVAIVTAMKRQQREEQQEGHEKQEKKQKNNEGSPVSQEVKDTQMKEKGPNEKWHRVAGHHVRKWAKRATKTKTKDPPSKHIRVEITE